MKRIKNFSPWFKGFNVGHNMSMKGLKICAGGCIIFFLGTVICASGMDLTKRK